MSELSRESRKLTDEKTALLRAVVERRIAERSHTRKDEGADTAENGEGGRLAALNLKTEGE